MENKNIFILLERLSNLVRNEMRKDGLTYGLQPTQLEALHYLSLCNRYSDTPKGVTEYLGQTKGTVSQSLKILEQKGFICKVTDPNDKRIVHLHITEDGKEIIQQLIPPKLFSELEHVMGVNKQEEVSSGLVMLLRNLQNLNNMKSFGVCNSCKNFIKDHNGSSFCNVTQENLSSEDSLKICLEHEPS